MCYLEQGQEYKIKKLILLLQNILWTDLNMKIGLIQTGEKDPFFCVIKFTTIARPYYHREPVWLREGHAMQWVSRLCIEKKPYVNTSAKISQKLSVLIGKKGKNPTDVL